MFFVQNEKGVGRCWLVPLANEKSRKRFPALRAGCGAIGLRASRAFVQIMQSLNSCSIALFGSYQEQHASLLAVLRHAVTLNIKFR